MAGGALAGYAVWSKEKQPQTQELGQLSAGQPTTTAPLFETDPALAGTGAAAGLQTASVQPALAQSAALAPAPQFAQVIDVDPVTRTTSTPKQQCHDEQVVHRKEVKDEHRVTGTVIGGALGGVLGNRIGKGSGRDVATVAGAIAGGYAGNRIQKNMQEGDTYTTTERRCTTVNTASKKTIGYDVTYRWNGDVNTVRMNSRPGDRLPVKNGEVLLVNAKNLAKYE